ncbi:hypothetical protein ACH5RR_008879 [Cinchona calisaya]|uniref:Uncharacterized protein n=1 Tax=Cinchona calisaya TaxID=153742 RepID=A0ABD3ACU5_9GENT
MLWREQREGESHHRRIVVVWKSGCGGQHMRSVPLSTTRNSLTDGGGDSSGLVSTVITTTSTSSFCKDGRTISVGDSALFEPPQDSPPFIGIIRCLRSSKENNLQLGVNWLYRPAELKLGKGILLDAAPNEIFYSFHKDEIPAASLLHPCKVAFLPEGVDLPTGISSFVCRRVYDIDNKCLWWLTDQDYINERQEEVDKLLQKTRIEMDASFQPDNRSPKPTNNSGSILQFKPGSDNMQSSATSIPSQTKGKKRERGDQSSDPPVKRERSLKPDDGDSGLYKSESSLRSETAKMTEKGALVDSESVEKLVRLMQIDKEDKKMDLVSRSMLSGVIAATDKFDCLNLFVQLKGLLVFDEWLQDVHKGKIGDSDKSAEDFLLVLLRALDKLPVNLHALQICNIGRSVNHLRSHKNLEIQKKSRSLVDTWKKRVEAEMNIIDAKSGSTHAASWPSKSRLPEAHGGRSSGGSGDVSLKSSVTQLSASKIMSIKVSQEETAGKSVPSPGAIKSASSPAFGKESHPRITAGSAADVPLCMREEKSSSSSQSHNYSQSFSGKEDARSSAGSMNVSKILSGGSRHRKPVNGFPGTLASGNQKETGSSRNSAIHRNTAQDKYSQSVVTGEKGFEAPAVEGSTPKLIVKLPNRGRSPAQSVSGGSFEDPSVMSSRASSPVLSDKHEVSECNTKEKADACRANVITDVNAESWQSNDYKDLHMGCDDGAGSPAALPDEERSRTIEDGIKDPEVPKAASSSSGIDLKSEKLHDPSFSSMNALIESCVKYSEASTPLSLGDDVGMNLLASVAAGEMYKSDLLTPADSPQVCTPPLEDLSNGEDFKSKVSPAETLARDQCQPNDVVDGDDVKQGRSPASSWSKDGACLSKQVSVSSTGDRKAAPAASEEILQATTVRVTEMNEKSDDILVSGSFSPTMKAAKDRDGNPRKQFCEEKDIEVKLSILSIKEDIKHKVEIPSNLTMERDCTKGVNEGSNTNILTEQKPAVIAEGKELPATGSVQDLAPENVDENKVREADENHGGGCVNQSEGAPMDPKTNVISSPEEQSVDGLCSDAADQKSDCSKANSEKKEVAEPDSFGLCAQKEELQSEEVVRDMDFRESKKSDAEAAGVEDRGSPVVGSTSLTAACVPDADSKMNFDLNEGLVGEDGKYGEHINLPSSGCLSTVHVVNPLSTTVSLLSSSIPASITVAAAAKGAFVPPVDLLRNKGELGWKGSAATSAFRPAEPRKVLQLPLGSGNVCPPDDSSSKPSRPPLDIDLNVPDDRVLEDMACRDSGAEIGSTQDHVSNLGRSRNEHTGSAAGRSSGGLDLDLNRVDDANDITQYSTSTCHRLEAPIVPFKSLPSSSLQNTEVKRDFDLNNGPGFDDGAAEQSSLTQNSRGSTHSVHSLPALAGFRSNNLEAGNFSAWFPPGTSYSSIAIPSTLPDRGEQPFPIIPPGAPQRILGPPGGTLFNPDVYRGSVLSSSPAVPFPPSPFPYQMFPFGTSLPLPSATFSVGSNSFMDSTSGGRIFTPPVNSQFLGPVAAVSSQYPRPYMVSLSDGSNNGGVESNRKWSRQGLDLNAGPGVFDIEGREESLAQRQLAVGSSQALVEEQTRMFQLSGGVLKRKEPEGGRDSESFRYKQSSWQ